MPPVVINGEQIVAVDDSSSSSCSFVIVKPPSLHDCHSFDQQLLDNIAYDALVWASPHGLLMGDKSSKNSGTVPGTGLVYAPFASLPVLLPESRFKRACDVALIFNELVDHVSLDANFPQESLSRTKKVDEVTSRLLDIHSKMLHLNKKGNTIGIAPFDEQTKSLLQIELNTISSSSVGFGSIVTELHGYILSHHGKLLGLDAEKVPVNNAASQNAEGLAKVWIEYNNPKAAIMFVVQDEERNMYDRHSLLLIDKSLRSYTSGMAIHQLIILQNQIGELGY